jgi:hypothetical protein
MEGTTKKRGGSYKRIKQRNRMGGGKKQLEPEEGIATECG